MIRYICGNIFDSKMEMIVNPVNCVGVMGKGLALEFKNRYPALFIAYKTACDRHLIKPGRIYIYLTNRIEKSCFSLQRTTGETHPVMSILNKVLPILLTTTRHSK